VKPLVEECLDYDPVVRPNITTICERIQLNKDAHMGEFPQDFIALYQLAKQEKNENEFHRSTIEQQKSRLEEMEIQFQQMVRNY